MHPQVRQDSPGPCPICGMDLIPVSQQTAEEQRLKEAGLETEVVVSRELVKEVRTVGKLDYAEPRISYVTARIAGRLDRLHADFTGIQVRAGDHLADIYSPELFVAQGELFRALEAVEKAQGDRTFAEATLVAARTKLRLLGITAEQSAALEKSRTIATHLTIHAPMGGTVIEKAVRVGQYVKEGDLLYRIADLDPLWLYLDVYEYDLAWVRFGQPVDVALEAFPGQSYRGTVVFVDPALDDKTRTVKVRVNLKNTERKLKPAMYSTASIRVRLRPDGTPEPTGLEGKYFSPMHPEVIRAEPGDCPICGMRLERIPGVPAAAREKPGQVLSVPVSAVLDTGRRKVAYRPRADGAYELIELTLGPKAEGQDAAGRTAAYYPVLSGLKEGDRVVSRGGFLLDSQRQIEGMPSLLFPHGQSGINLHSGHGEPPRKPSEGGGHKH